MYLSEIHTDVEIAYLTAEWDFVEPSDRERFKKQHKQTDWYALIEMFHNTTMLGSDRTADCINASIRKPYSVSFSDIN